MSDFVLKALDYGVLGLCAVTLVFIASIIRAEQKREGHPRKGIMDISRLFMGFCIVLALINGYVQLNELAEAAKDFSPIRRELAATKVKLEAASEKVSDCRSILQRLGGMIDIKALNEAARDNCPMLNAISRKLQETMSTAKSWGLLDQ